MICHVQVNLIKTLSHRNGLVDRKWYQHNINHLKVRPYSRKPYPQNVSKRQKNFDYSTDISVAYNVRNSCPCSLLHTDIFQEQSFRGLFPCSYIKVFQKQPPEVFCKKKVFKNFANFTGKHLRWSLFLIKMQTGFLPLCRRCFPLNYANF